MAGTLPIVTTMATATDRLALGVLTSRLLEDSEIVLGIVSVLAMVTLRQDLTGVNVVEQALAGARDWTLLNGPSSAGHHSTAPDRPGASTTDRSTTMSTNTSMQSKASRIRTALGITAVVAVLAAGLAACAAPRQTSDPWQQQPVSEVEPDEIEGDEFEPSENENERDENERSEHEKERDENEADEDGDDGGDEGDEDEDEADENEEGDGEDD